MPRRSKCDDPKLQHCCQPLNLIKEVDIPILIQQLTVLRTVVSMHCLARAVLKNEYMFANVQRRPLLRRWQTLIASFRMSALPKAVRPHPLRAAFHVVGSRGAGNRRHLASVLRQGRKTRILTPVWESSGESRFKTLCAQICLSTTFT